MRQGSKPGALVERDTLPDAPRGLQIGIWNRNAGAGTSRSNLLSWPAENMESGFPRPSLPETPRCARGHSHGACAGGLAHAP
ncbi:hypothetical protein CapIbe_011056 [Capra ibex]